MYSSLKVQFTITYTYMCMYTADLKKVVQKHKTARGKYVEGLWAAEVHCCLIKVHGVSAWCKNGES